MSNALIGKIACIKANADSPYAGQWGIIKWFDGENYYIAMWGGEDQMVFVRNEFKVRRR